MAAYLCLIALIFVVINLVVDLLYFAVDPRLRLGKAEGIDVWRRFPQSPVQWPCLRAHCHVPPELTAFRRDLHAHPELGFEEVYTAAASRGAASCAASTKSTRHRQDRRGGRDPWPPRQRRQGAHAIGLRADMDALP
jgi:hypothetical protein